MFGFARCRLVRTLHAVRARCARPLQRSLCADAKAAPPSPPSLLQHIQTQVASEVAGSTKSRAHFFGFYGALCNWFLGISAVYDAMNKGPEVISLNMTGVMLCYSTLFATWAGWAVMPRNFILCASHMFNVVAQSNQLRRVLVYKMENEPGAKEEIAELATKAAAGAAVVGLYAASAGRLKTMVAPYGPAYLSSPAGPFTIHPWPPVTKLMISGASLMELNRPTDKISLSQYSALTLTGLIFSFYGMAVTPINYPLTSVNILLCSTSAWHLGRKVKADFF